MPEKSEGPLNITKIKTRQDKRHTYSLTSLVQNAYRKLGVAVHHTKPIQDSGGEKIPENIIQFPTKIK